MGNMALKAVSKKGKDKLKKLDYDNVLPIPCRLLMEESTKPVEISKHCEGSKAILFVNVASKWGLTDKNYK